MRRAEPLLALAAAAAMVAAALAAPWLKFVLTIALAKGMAALGIMLLLRAGQVVFLGSVCTPVWLSGPCRVTVSFGALGEASAELV